LAQAKEEGMKFDINWQYTDSSAKGFSHSFPNEQESRVMEGESHNVANQCDKSK